jgi:hypothetical protein
MKTTIILTMLLLVGCGGADFTVGAARGDTGDDDAEETSDDTGAVSADTDAADAPDALPTDTGGKPDTSIAPDTGIDTGTLDTGTPDTGVPPIDSGADVPDGPCPDLDGDGQTDIRCGGTDCHDGNKDVFVGQTAVFSSPYTIIGGGSSWDYNCNGKADLWVSSLVSCSGSCSLTPSSAGWLDGVVPPCGSTGKWVASCTGSCVITTTTKKQLCN